MGKKKTQAQHFKVQDPERPVKERNEKGKKTYSLQSSKAESCENEIKIRIPQSLENELVAIIQEDFKKQKITKELSNRLTNKKLMDMYTSLIQAGFSHTQIEQALNNSVLHGGDLIDALDWLCLNIANDKLPQGFSETMEKEEASTSRPKFDSQLLESRPSVLNNPKNQDRNPAPVVFSKHMKYDKK